MNVPSLAWLQDPWSPAGYDVVELADDAPSNRPSDRREMPQTPRSPLGYQVVEVAQEASPEAPECPADVDLAVEEVLFAADSGTEAGADDDPAPARAVKLRRSRHPRRRLLWAGLAMGAYCMAALALVLVLVRLPAQARSVAPPEVQTQKQKTQQWGAWTTAPDDASTPERQNFQTAIDFVRNPQEAGRIADKQHKLTFLLHVSGNFEDPGFT
jgi:hypothetical protein